MAEAASIQEADKIVSAEEYLEQYAHDHYEWVEGRLVKISPASSQHDDITGYLRELFRAYFALCPGGIVKSAPFVMRLEKSFREPDVMVILGENVDHLKPTAMEGPADIVIEVVSPESIARDHGEKYAQYQQESVGEYWIIDPLSSECRFNRLTKDGHFKTVHYDSEGEYTTPLLPGLVIDVSIFWQGEMPTFFEVGDAVRAMLGAERT